MSDERKPSPEALNLALALMSPEEIAENPDPGAVLAFMFEDLVDARAQRLIEKNWQKVGEGIETFGGPDFRAVAKGIAMAVGAATAEIHAGPSLDEALRTRLDGMIRPASEAERRPAALDADIARVRLARFLSHLPMAPDRIRDAIDRLGDADAPLAFQAVEDHGAQADRILGGSKP
jgi:hypothetical protein